MSLIEFINEYYVVPYLTDSVGYNFFNTITYALLAIGLLYLAYKVLQKYKIKIDLKFFIAILPFILTGATLRAFVDNKIIPYSLYAVSPGNYLVFGILFFITYGIFYKISKKPKQSATILTALSGSLMFTLIVLFNYKKIHLTNPLGFFVITTTFLVSSTILYLVFKKLKWSWATQKTAFIAISSHLLDATTTFIIVDFFGGWEKHPLPRYFASNFGSAITQFPLKLIVLIPLAYLINTELKDKNLRNFLFLAIASLGLAQGLRNLLSLIII